MGNNVTYITTHTLKADFHYTFFCASALIGVSYFEAKVAEFRCRASNVHPLAQLS